MSTQIAVRLPDDLVAYVDEQVRTGRAASRADAVHRALRREHRRAAADADAAIYAAALHADETDEFAGLRAHVAKRPLDLD
jgi:Arc/MetJ-type ribon-helix-helix transcriptional regulator